MKKCPYCHTFMNDDINSCPNCLKDMSNLKPMPDVNPSGSNKNLNLIIYGAILSAGGAIASISQYGLIDGYQSKLDEVLSKLVFISDLESAQYKTLAAEAAEYALLINDCELRTVLFMVLAVIGLVIIGVSAVLMIKNKLKRKGK